MKGTIKRVTVCIMLSMLIILSIADIGATVSVQGEKVQWNLVIEMNQEQSRFAQMTAANLIATMQSRKVSSSVEDGNLELSGAHNLEELRIILFNTAAQWVDFLGGPVELTLEMPADNPLVTLLMETRMTAGYRWEILPIARSRFFQSGESTFTPRYRGFGAPSIQTIQIRSRGVGDSTLTLVYRRPFQRDAPMKARLNISVTGVGDLIELSDPTPSELKSERSISDGEEPNLFIEFQDKGVPASWDWRTQIPNIVPDVRDQAACGSCWAFGTVGVMESALKKGGGPLTDRSEQFLISCNNDGWNCNGGLTANEYHYNTLGKNQTVVGAVLESVKPYTASNGTCTVAYNHPYKLNGWQFITGSEWTMPTNDQLKNAIYTYGPVTAGVCADSGWDSYTGGIYAPGNNQCGGSTNHQIILVGWDDSTQSWILRNSWGAGWGENGYMRIKYDPAGSNSRVGEGTSWVTYQNQGCSYSISPTSATGSISGGSGSIAVTASAGTCAWTATSTSWITITSGSSGTGNGTVSYSYTANNTGSMQSGTIIVEGETFTLTQESSLVDPQLSNGVALNQTMTAPVWQGTTKYYNFDLPSGSSNLVIDLYNLTGDLDLYLRQGSKPTLSSYDCRPYKAGLTSESCSFSSPSSGRWWIGVTNWATGTFSYTIKASWSDGVCSGGVVVLQNMTFVSGNTYNCIATTSITAGTGVTVQSGATVNFRAPKINLQPGFKVESGAVFSAKQ
jgi:C1A family cysteine protease